MRPWRKEATLTGPVFCRLCFAVCSGADGHQRGHQAADSAGGGLPRSQRRGRGARTFSGQKNQLRPTGESRGANHYGGGDLCSINNLIKQMNSVSWKCVLVRGSRTNTMRDSFSPKSLCSSHRLDVTRSISLRVAHNV